MQKYSCNNLEEFLKNWQENTRYFDFFPKRDEPFSLILPDNKILSAKICQDGGKALMSNPNCDLGKWILRKVLKKEAWQIVTMEDLDRLGFNSVTIENLHTIDNNGKKLYKIYFSNSNDNYLKFKEEYLNK